MYIALSFLSLLAIRTVLAENHNFSQSCRNYAISNKQTDRSPILTYECQLLSGSFIPGQIELGSVLRNNHGELEWGLSTYTHITFPSINTERLTQFSSQWSST